MRVRVFVPCLLISIGTAHADDLLRANAAEDPIVIGGQHTAVSGSFDADSIGNRSVYVDGTYAPFSDIDASGMLFRATGTADWYRFLATENPRVVGTGHNFEGGLLAGYAISSERFNIAGLVGPAFGQIVNQGVSTDRWGAKAVIEVYATPTDLTIASGSASYSTIANYLQVEAKTGLKIFNDVYVGPEARFTWQQIPNISPQTNVATMRLGAHVSALRIGPTQIAVSGGWAHDQQLGSGYYGSVNLYLPF